MKLFKTIDEKFDRLGFIKTYETDIYCIYEKREKRYNYVHEINICRKESGNHIVISCQKDINLEGLNNAIGLTKKEMKLCIKKMKEMGM